MVCTSFLPDVRGMKLNNNVNIKFCTRPLVSKKLDQKNRKLELNWSTVLLVEQISALHFHQQVDDMLQMPNCQKKQQV